MNSIPFLGSGDSTSLFINLTIDSNFIVGEIINNAEIVAADGGIDEDDPLSNTNDGTTNELATDNNIDDDGQNTPGTTDLPSDEDDYDPALIMIDCREPAQIPQFIRKGN